MHTNILNHSQKKTVVTQNGSYTFLSDGVFRYITQDTWAGTVIKINSVTVESFDYGTTSDWQTIGKDDVISTTNATIQFIPFK